MKKLFFVCSLAMMFCSCNNVISKVSALTGKVGAKSDLTTDSIVIDKDQQHAKVHYYVDFPTDGSELLVNAIREYVNEQLGGTYNGDESNGQVMIDTYAQQEWTSLVSQYNELAGETENEFIRDISFYTEYEIRLLYETDKFVTYQTFMTTYLGGAHGMHNLTGVTFRKTDGRRFGYDMMRQLYSEEFYTITKEGLISYFSQSGMGKPTTDEELKEWLMTSDDVNYLSHPRCEPYMVEDGVTFVYQPYEIAPYAAGMPEFTVSYQDIKPFLTVGAQKMIP